jgi:cytochrome c biogenesis protein CcmG, thiol:disulfide interchange protein DsbE
MSTGPRYARYGAIGVGICVLALVVVLATRSDSPQSAATTTLGGRIAPPVAGTDIVTGKAISLAALRGRYVIVDFFASWCAPCLDEEPQIESFVFAHRTSTKVSLIGVDIEDSVGNARQFFSKYGATWPAVVDGIGIDIAQSYGVAQPPELFLVNPKGRVVGSISHAVTADELDAWVGDAEALGT